MKPHKTYVVSQFINGKKVTDSSSDLHPITNPALGETIGQVAYANSSEINEAVSVAEKTFPKWSQTPAVKRARIIFKFKELLEKNIKPLAKLVTQEHGKFLDESEASILRGLELVEFACGIPYLLRGSFSENAGTEINTYTFRQPLGVCVGITPFNFPVMIPIWMFINSIACGNTFILKPSEKDPSPSIFMAELMQSAGLPDGVLNVLQGAQEVVQQLITHPDVSAVSFVGSTKAAEQVYQSAIAHGKRAQAFGGAKNHGLVMPDADLETTADALLNAAYGSAGERCMAISVALVVGDQTADRLVEVMKNKINAFHVAPLISAEHLKKVSDYIEIGTQEGAHLIVDGRATENKTSGYYLKATLFDHVKPSMRIYREEIFGPILAIVRVKDFDTALQLINDHEYGNGTAIFTRDGKFARDFASRIQVGMVGINVPVPVPIAFHAFGGWKRSVFGDIGMHGDESVRFYTKSKSVITRWE